MSSIALRQTTSQARILGLLGRSLNKVLKELESDGLIATSYGTITIHDETRLAKRAG